MFMKFVFLFLVFVISCSASPLYHNIQRQARAEQQAFDGLYDNTFYRGYGSQGLSMRFDGQPRDWY